MSMSLLEELTGLINASHRYAWARFDHVRGQAVNYGLIDASVAKWKTPGEPAFVSSLLEYPMATHRLSEAIKRHLKPLGLCSATPLVSGVFIHQKPKIRFTTKRSEIELGDLLLVRQHFRSAVAEPEGKAFLIQAKSAAKPETGSLRGKEALQHKLYSNWATPFTFPYKEIGPPPDGSTHWNFELGPMHHSASGVYGIVSNSKQATGFPDDCAWAIGAASSVPMGVKPSVEAPDSLAEIMEKFLLGQWGRAWEAAPATSDHWSSFIVRCLEASVTWKPYPVQRLGSQLPRRRDAVHLLLGLGQAPHHRPPYRNRAQDLVEAWNQSFGSDGQGGEPPSVNAEWDLQPPSVGISVLYVATYGDGPLSEQGASPANSLS